MTEAISAIGAADSPTAASGERAVVECKSQVVRVTLFEDRAEVVRRLQGPLTAGVSWLRIASIATMVSDPSVLASVVTFKAGDARILSSRVVRRIRQVPLSSESEIHARQAEQQEATQRSVRAERAVEAHTTHELRIAGLINHWIRALRRVPQTAAQDLTSWRTAYEQLSTAQQGALDALFAARAEQMQAQRDVKRCDLRLAQARRIEPRFEAAIELQIESSAPGVATLEVSYRTPCALWRPEHQCRLSTESDGSHSLQITTWATAWQCTGEDWRDVPLRFSTARPAQAATAPSLSEDALRLRRKTDQEKRTVVVEAREQQIAVAGLNRGQRAVEEMPGVDDGGEPLLLSSARPTSLPSTGMPIRVEIGSLTLPCQVERIAYPERSIGAHLRATATLTGTRPLLAGPVHIIRGGELAGRSRILFVAPGEPFELGFGIDDGVRVRRRVDETRETTAVLGTQKITRTVRLFLSNLSDAKKPLQVTERVPVSEIRDVEITVVQTPGMRYDSKDGFARFACDLEPGATRELSFSYRIEAGARVVLPSL